MKIPVNVPDKGLYYHYKHNLDDNINNYAYEVIGVGIQSEEKDGSEEDQSMVVYRPLYEIEDFTDKNFFILRPLKMFMENITRDGEIFPRFQKITDAEITGVLEAVKKEMYGGSYIN